MTDILYIDFETYWDKDVTLKKLNYTDYITHPKFAVHCASAVWKGAERFLESSDIRPFLEDEVGQNVIAVAHNAHFDGYIAHHCYNWHPRAWHCTQAMGDAVFQGAVARSLDALLRAFGLPPKLEMPDFKARYWGDLTDEEKHHIEEYARRDVKHLPELYEGLKAQLPQRELDCMAVTLDMFMKPRLELNRALVEEALQNAEGLRSEVLQAAGVEESEVRSDDKFAELLIAAGLDNPPRKWSAKQDKEVWAFAKSDAAFMALQECSNPRIEQLVEARLVCKSSIHITRAQRMLTMAKQPGRKLAVCLNYAKAHTLRWTGGNKMNLQNLVKGSKLRLAIEAPDGYVLAVADSSQIECRDLAWLAREDKLLGIFHAKEDPYLDLARDVFQKPLTKKENPVERFVGKTAVLGLGFTMGAPKFQLSVKTLSRNQLGKELVIEDELAYRVVDTFRSKYYRIPVFWQLAEWAMNHLAFGVSTKPLGDTGLEVDANAKRILFPNGTWLYYPGIGPREDGSWAYLATRKDRVYEKPIHRGLLVENIVQKHARDIIVEQLLRVNPRYPVVMTTHDELVALVPEKEATEGLDWILDNMRIPPVWAHGLPLDAEGGFARNYSK